MSIKHIVDGFPFPTMDPIIGLPNYETIAELRLKLNSNAASVHSNLGCGTLGLLQLTVSPAVYATLSATAFVVPLNPRSEAIVPDGLTGAQIANIRYAFKAATTSFNEYKATDKALRQLLLTAVDEMHVRTLRHWYTGYRQTPTRQLLDHPYATYTKISPADLQNNDMKIRSPYDANHPIKNLFDQVENAVEYAAAGDTLYTPEQVVAITYQFFSSNRLIPRRLQSLETQNRT